MAVLTAARNAPMKDNTGFVRAYPVGSDIVYAGGIVSMLISGGTGVLLAGQDTANHIFVGIAKDTVDGTGGDSPMCEVYTEGSVLLDAGQTATTAWVGVLVYITDDQTVDLAATPTNDVLVGRVESVDTTNNKVWVRMLHTTA